jgi:DNA transformation protein and related proteins
MKDTLYLRVDKLTRTDFDALGAQAFTYKGQSKPVKVASYCQLPDEIVDAPDQLIHWAMRASHAAAAAKIRFAPRPGSRTDRLE